MKKLILLFILLFIIDSQSARAQDVVSELFKVEVGPTLVETDIRGTFHLEADKGKLVISVYDLNMQLQSSIYDYPHLSYPLDYSFDSSGLEPGIYIVHFDYTSIYGERDTAHYKVQK